MLKIIKLTIQDQNGSKYSEIGFSENIDVTYNEKYKVWSTINDGNEISGKTMNQLYINFMKEHEFFKGENEYKI